MAAGKGKQGHDGGDGRHEDSKGRHDDGKGQQGVRRHDNLSVFFLPRRQSASLSVFCQAVATRGSNGKVGQSGDCWKALFKAKSFSTSN